MSAVLIPLVNVIREIKKSPEELEKRSIFMIPFLLIYQKRLMKKALKLTDKINTVDAEMLQEFISLIETSPGKRNDQINNAALDKDTGLYILDFHRDEAPYRNVVSLKSSMDKISIDFKGIDMRTGELYSHVNFYIKGSLITGDAVSVEEKDYLAKINSWLLFYIKDFLTSELLKEK